MSSLFPRASLRRSSRTRTRKGSVSVDMDIVRPSHSSTLSHRKTRPPPLQIIPELSENELDVDISSAYSPATARPTQSFLQLDLKTPRVTLSAYTFSIDDTLLKFGEEAPRSPALSASSTSDGVSSEGVPTTPGTSDDEIGYDLILPGPRYCPQRISIRPLCVTKTHSLICPEDEDIHSFFEKDEEKANPLSVIEQQPDASTEAMVAMALAEEVEQDFYAHEFEGFISLSPVVPSPTSPARRDSITLVSEALPTVIDVCEPKPRGRSRHSKPLPLLPPATPSASSFALIPNLPLVQTSARHSFVRRKRNISSLPNHPLLPPESRPLPRVAVPLDVEDCIFPEDNFDVPSCEPTVIRQDYDADVDAGTYCQNQSSFVCIASTSTGPLPPAMPETPFSGMYGKVSLPRSSTDSDAPRSSVDSASSFASSISSNTPISPFSFPSSPSLEDPELESPQRLRSRWSSSTLASLAAEPPQTPTLLSPFKSVLGSRARRVLLPPQKVPPHMPPHFTPPKAFKTKHGFPTTSSPLSALGKHLRRQGSRSSTSSAGTSSSGCDSRDGSPIGLKRKPIPVAMFLRAS